MMSHQISQLKEDLQGPRRPPTVYIPTKDGSWRSWRSLLELSLLVYFFMTYVFLPRDPKTGAWPRISPVYSTWPFTSCIGGMRLAVYKAFAFVVASLYQCGSFISLYLTWKKESGYWFRRAGHRRWIRLVSAFHLPCLLKW